MLLGVGRRSAGRRGGGLSAQPSAWAWQDKCQPLLDPGELGASLAATENYRSCDQQTMTKRSHPRSLEQMKGLQSIREQTLKRVFVEISIHSLTLQRWQRAASHRTVSQKPLAATLHFCVKCESVTRQAAASSTKEMWHFNPTWQVAHAELHLFPPSAPLFAHTLLLWAGEDVGSSGQCVTESNVNGGWAVLGEDAGALISLLVSPHQRELPHSGRRRRPRYACWPYPFSDGFPEDYHNK